MDKKPLSFNQKIQLYEDLKKYFESSKIKSETNNINSIIYRLEKWGKELKIRKNYYDI